MKMTKYFSYIFCAFLFCSMLITPPAEASQEKGELVEMTTTNFNKVIADDYTVVDFYANWCGPCKRIAPLFQTIASEMSEKATFAKANVDTIGAKVTSTSQIKSIPTFIIYKDGKEISRRVGSCDEETLRAFITAAID